MRISADAAARLNKYGRKLRVRLAPKYEHGFKSMHNRSNPKFYQ